MIEIKTKQLTTRDKIAKLLDRCRQKDCNKYDNNPLFCRDCRVSTDYKKLVGIRLEEMAQNE